MKISKNRIYKLYMHINLINNKIYIGITMRKLKQRWKNNGIGYKNQIVFYNAIQKYGWSNFRHELIFQNLTKEEAEMLEIELIKYYKTTDRRYGYNVANGGTNGNLNLKRSESFCKLMSEYAKKRTGEKSNHYNKPHSEETKRKIGLTSKGRKHSIEAKIKMSQNSTSKRKVRCIDTQEVFNSIIEASKKLGLYQNHISAVCLGKRKTTGGLRFEYINEVKSDEK